MSTEGMVSHWFTSFSVQISRILGDSSYFGWLLLAGVGSLQCHKRQQLQQQQLLPGRCQINELLVTASH